jgi:hypothetical protein
MANPTNFLFDVFLSHNSKDKTRVRRLAERLRAAGLRVWFDGWVIRPGDDIYLSLERGLEQARTLVLCMSPAAFGADWVALERSTVLFRDPTNEGRRFVPLLLADCEMPDAVRRYRYVDYREEGEAAFRELVGACRAEEEHWAEPVKEAERGGPIGPLEWRLKGHKRSVSSVVFSPDGKWLASGAEDNKVRVWNIETGDCQAALEGHAAPVTCVAFLPDGTRLVSAAHDQTIRIWGFPSGRQERILISHRHIVKTVVPFASGGRLLAVGDDGSIKVWNTSTWECTRAIQTGEAESAVLCADQKRVLVGDRRGQIALWDLEAGERLVTPEEHSNIVRSVAITPDGRYGFSGSQDATIRVWNLESAACMGTLEGHRGDVVSIALSPQGNWVASASADTTIRLWDWRLGLVSKSSGRTRL